MEKIEYIPTYFFSGPLQAFASAFLFFVVLYFGFTLPAWAFVKQKRATFGLSAYQSTVQQQINSEIKLSLRSIIVFALQAILLQLGYQHGIFKINWQIDYIALVPEVLLLFIWNEIHFFMCHRVLHSPWLFRHVHHMHHASHVPTPFSTYSFHWFEAFLLGSVMFVPLIVYPFQIVALLLLPVISIVLNVFGHWNLDFFPGKGPDHLLKFSYRHTMHHQRVKGNYGFMLPYLDMLFKTDLK